MAPPVSVLITGANRGVGLGLVRKFLEIPTVKHVFAATRNPDNSTDLTSLKDARLQVVKFDVEDDKSIENTYKKVESVVGDAGLNLLLNNAGVFVPTWTTGKKKFTRQEMHHSFDVNTVGVAMTIQQFLPLLRKAAASVAGDGAHRAAIVNISSMWASIKNNSDGSSIRGSLAYKMSKAALNQMGRTMGHDLSDDGIIVTQFCPGWVQTEMGGKQAAITVDQSAAALVHSINNLTKEQHSGGFFDRNLKHYEF